MRACPNWCNNPPNFGVSPSLPPMSRSVCVPSCEAITYEESGRASGVSCHRVVSFTGNGGFAGLIGALDIISPSAGPERGRNQGNFVGFTPLVSDFMPPLQRWGREVRSSEVSGYSTHRSQSSIWPAELSDSAVSQLNFGKFFGLAPREPRRTPPSPPYFRNSLSLNLAVSEA